MVINEVLYAENKDGSIQEWFVAAIGDEVHVTYGKQYGKKTTKITKAKPKNIGKANYTSPEAQAIKEATAKWTKQLDKGYFTSVEEALNTIVRLPMLANDYLKVSHNIVYPCYVSKKLDGVRCLVLLDLDSGRVTLITRGGKNYKIPHLEEQLLRLGREIGRTWFDGEVYLHGTPLNQINSLVKTPCAKSLDLQFHIFDLPDDLGTTFEGRYEALVNIGKLLNAGEYPHLRMVHNDLVQDEEEARAVMNTYLEEGYEGLMLRNIWGIYEWASRSQDLQKWKDFFDLEAKVVSVSEDRLNEGVLLCEMPNGEFVECKMKGDHEYRSYDNMKKLVGAWVNIKYQGFTEYGSLSFPVGMYVRECDQFGNPLV